MIEAQTQRELPRYKCHKEVHALKIKLVLTSPSAFDPNGDFHTVLFPEDQNFLPIPVDAGFVFRHKPEAPGYYVVYEDGYQSFSPVEAFEKGYTEI